MARFPIEGLLLQGDMDAAGYTIFNLNKSGLLLVKADVGLGNVDNTSDDLKPISQAMFTALAGKEASIPYGTVGQFLRGDKTWVALGALAFEGEATGLDNISTIAHSTSGTAILKVNRHDVHAAVSIRQTGEASAGTILPGVNLANAGQLAFDGCSVAVIKTSNACPIIFGVNNAERMRLNLGLNVGGTADPGSGCITAFGTITAGTSLVSGGTLIAAGAFSANSGAIALGLEVGSLNVDVNILGTGGISISGNIATSGNLVAGGTIVNFTHIPTSDPHIAGQIWRSTNDVKISTG